MSDFSAWFSEKQFTTDWTSSRFALWHHLFHERRDTVQKVLEIGAWEGRSAIFFLRFFPESLVYCIDTFGGSARHELDDHWRDIVSNVEDRFDGNVAEFGQRCRKLKGSSFERLAQLAIARESFDLIYVDGSHHSIDVYVDAVMSWHLLVDGGVLIFDDYTWTEVPGEENQPRIGIDAFLETTRGHYEILHKGSQVILLRQSPAPRA